MVTFNVNGNSRAANGGGGNGLAVDTGGNVAWVDGSTREAALQAAGFEVENVRENPGDLIRTY